MPKSNYDFSFKFFHPPQRTVPTRNGLLDTRTKHIIAQDRLVVAEQRFINAERRKSLSNLQLLAFEQKQIEKRLSSLYNNINSSNMNQPLKMRGRSTSEVIFRNMRRTSSWTDTLPIHHSKLSVSLNDSNQNLLSLPKLYDIHRRLSTYSDDDTSDNPLFTTDIESSDEAEKTKSYLKIPSRRKSSIKSTRISKLSDKKPKSLPPIVAVIPPDEDVLFLTQ